jgi:hypothetical protein
MPAPRPRPPNTLRRPTWTPVLPQCHQPSPRGTGILLALGHRPSNARRSFGRLDLHQPTALRPWWRGRLACDSAEGREGVHRPNRSCASRSGHPPVPRGASRMLALGGSVPLTTRPQAERVLWTRSAPADNFAAVVPTERQLGRRHLACAACGHPQPPPVRQGGPRTPSHIRMAQATARPRGQDACAPTASAAVGGQARPGRPNPRVRTPRATLLRSPRSVVPGEVTRSTPGATPSPKGRRNTSPGGSLSGDRGAPARPAAASQAGRSRRVRAGCSRHGREAPPSYPWAERARR